MKPIVLVVEDDESVAQVLEVALTNAGFEARFASDGQAGWQAFQAERPDIVLSDIKMPEMDGMDLLRRIKEIDPDMEVILLTGHGDLSSAIQAVELGAYRYLEKPVGQMTDLIHTVEKALEKRQLRLERQFIDRISSDLSRRLSLPDCLDQFLLQVLSAFPQVDAAFVSLYDPDEECLTIIRAQGFSDNQELIGSKMLGSWSVAARVLRQAISLRIDAGRLNRQELERARQAGELTPLMDLAYAHPTMGAVGIPIISHDEPIGSLEIINFVSLEALDDHLIGLLTTLCSQIGLYLDNARLFAEREAQTGRLQAVLDSTVDGILVVDPDGLVIMTNPRYGTMFSPAGELDATAQKQLIVMLQVALGAQENTKFVFTLEHPASDEPSVLEIYAAQVRQDGKSIGIVASLRDVTLERSRERKWSELLRLAKHEIGTPLEVIRLCAGTLLNESGPEPDEQQDDDLREIIRQAREVDSLVGETLDYSEVNEALLTRPQTPTDLSQLAAELAQEAAILAEENGHRLIAEVEPDLWVRGNYFLLKQALRNLLDNARKFTPRGGMVTWRVCRDDPNVRIQVVDSGVGIPQDELEKIFDPYYRASTANDTDGTGLGLSIVRDVINAHRGKIEVESTEGEGSRFTVTLLAVPPFI